MVNANDISKEFFVKRATQLFGCTAREPVTSRRRSRTPANPARARDSNSSSTCFNLRSGMNKVGNDRPALLLRRRRTQGGHWWPSASPVQIQVRTLLIGSSARTRRGPENRMRPARSAPMAPVTPVIRYRAISRPSCRLSMTGVWRGWPSGSCPERRRHGAWRATLSLVVRAPHVRMAGSPDPMVAHGHATSPIDLSVYRTSQQFRIIQKSSLRRTADCGWLEGRVLLFHRGLRTCAQCCHDCFARPT
ncbi:hypothetical protein V1525DRAFT_402004 [Lipomyces kononenkoae]|uniref:Uncharacterized protein n=1 Tax=Lipomyces kononenkoae TaxID=34357 RepID=A0ACC3T4V6_LIPKO